MNEPQAYPGKGWGSKEGGKRDERLEEKMNNAKQDKKQLINKLLQF